MMKSKKINKCEKKIDKRVLIKIGYQEERVCFWREILNNCMVAHHTGDPVTIKKYD